MAFTVDWLLLLFVEQITFENEANKLERKKNDRIINMHIDCIRDS